MIALKIKDTKKMMQTLLYTESFDAFSLQEATIIKASSLYLEGRIHPEYYSEQDLSDEPELMRREFISFAEVRSLLADFMKGTHPPVSFKIVLQASPAFTGKLVNDPDFTGDPDNVKALILTFRFDQNGLTCLTGTSMKSFSLDKSIDSLWDKRIRKSFDHMQISFDDP